MVEVEQQEEESKKEGREENEIEIEAEAEAAPEREDVRDSDKESETKSLKPWEQHAAVINLPRFDYNAPSLLLHRSHSGFLVTCSIKREKSATKELMSILEKLVSSHFPYPSYMSFRWEGTAASCVKACSSIHEWQTKQSGTTCKVGYNRRGLEETSQTTSNTVQDTSKDSNLYSLLDNKCFEVVASAVKDVVSDSSVDLKSPELSILVELLPISGVPKGTLFAAVSVLPTNLISVKPRLCIKPLVSDANVKNGKS